MRTLLNQTKTVWIIALCAVTATLLTLQVIPAQAQSAGITVSKSTVTIEESGTTNSFTVVLDTQPETSVTLSATNSETTQFSTSLSYLTFTNANWNTPQTITLTPTSDDVADGDTSATITLSVLDATSDDTYDNVADVTVAVTVSDNNACDVTVVETNGTTMVTEAATTDTFTVKLAAQPTSNVVVSVVSSDIGEATVDKATLTFTSSNWNTTQTVTVTGVDDALNDDNQIVPITLAFVDASSDDCFDPTSDTTVSTTVSDNDSPGITVSVVGGTIAVTEKVVAATATTAGNTDSFTVVLNKQPATSVVLSVTSSDTGEITLNPTQLTFTNANWSTPQTVTVTGANDTQIDGTQSANVTISVVDASSDDTYDAETDIVLSATNEDDDAVVATTTTTTTTTTLPPVAVAETVIATGPSCETGPSADCREADLSGKVFFYSDLSEIQLQDSTLVSATFVNADLSNAKMNRSNLERANIKNSFLYGVDLSEANMYLADLSNSELPYAVLQNATMLAVNATNSELVRANLRNADLRFANLNGADLAKADLTGADPVSYTHLPLPTILLV